MLQHLPLQPPSQPASHFLQTTHIPYLHYIDSRITPFCILPQIHSLPPSTHIYTHPGENTTRSHPPTPHDLITTTLHCAQTLVITDISPSLLLAYATISHDKCPCNECSTFLPTTPVEPTPRERWTLVSYHHAPVLAGILTK